ncbi:hypothetical protein N656DRAFT_231217 [Canariomyces notabilis]|uniref:Uncharacterized protein n=1 Tax=Canariomyces notabilis TaxID=2074819 RepID=A0AAN6YWD7_9PEZI|nr:hypothetical protein N656DRAFT_231217 [Canariomyces arenarius]
MKSFCGFVGREVIGSSSVSRFFLQLNSSSCNLKNLGRKARPLNSSKNDGFPARALCRFLLPQFQRLSSSRLEQDLHRRPESVRVGYRVHRNRQRDAVGSIVTLLLVLYLRECKQRRQCLELSARSCLGVLKLPKNGNSGILYREIAVRRIP